MNLHKYQRMTVLRYFLLGCMMAVSTATTVTLAASEQQELLATIHQQLEHSGTTVQACAGDFEQRKFIAVLPLPLVSHGHFQYTPTSGLLWVVSDPIKSRLVFDADGVRQDVRGKEIMKIDSKQAGVAMIGKILTAMLSADWKTLESYFLIRGKGVTQEDASLHWTLELLPKEQALQKIFKSITLSGARSIQKMILFEPTGDRSEIVFQMKKAKANKKNKDTDQDTNTDQQHKESVHP